MTTVAATAAQPEPAARKAATGLGADFNAFLGLLTTQLKNQDPTKAMDAQAMTQQLVQFASVEQQIAMNGNLEKLIGLQQAAQLTAAAPLMGRVIEVESDRLTLQDGLATLRLPAAGAATRTRIAVLDQAGRTLREEEVALGPQPMEWRWDGRNAAGRRQPDGAYRIAVAGRDTAGNPQPVTATVLGRATAAEREGGALKLALGGLSVGFDAVRRVAGP